MLPALAPELGYAAGLSAALSLGDMTVIALFGSQQFQTLPWLLYQTMARYRSGEAAALALLLLCLTVGIFLLFHLMSRKIESKTHA
jgi:thiamine transport system permease protein